jgi:hypothetical protein
VLEIAARAFSHQNSGEGGEGIPANRVFVVFEVFHQRFRDGCAIFSGHSFELGAQVVDQFASFLNCKQHTFFISALGSSRHFANALESYAI